MTRRRDVRRETPAVCLPTAPRRGSTWNGGRSCTRLPPLPLGEGVGLLRGLSLLASRGREHEATVHPSVASLPPETCPQRDSGWRTLVVFPILHSPAALRADRAGPPECCTAQAIRLPWQCSSQVPGGRAQLTSVTTRFGGAPHPQLMVPQKGFREWILCE